MKGRITALLTVVALMFAATGWAQQQTGEIFGRVSDTSGAVLPGVTVTLTGPALLQPQTAITSENGAYQFPRIPIGTYTVKFDMPGFKSLVREGVRVEIGFTAQINAQLAITEVQETITVTGESPIVDTRSTTEQTTFDLEKLQSIPSARDPWVMLERTPGISNDRVNVGGTQSGQQSNYVSRGSATGNNKWAIDGVDITDMSATGASPIYYDFDMLQEMQVTTGGADASQQTGGVGINFVTRN
ncbi:MAG TPA: carboxypeptidase regulatory-like domain-containing protein, partial [Vicinamibacterales bacterium]|nr:carboxypeptidase regulatory-like domain-containing protein [Vicinamibacterales bacterium]